MRAAFIHGIRDVRIGELPVPVVPSDEVLLDVAAVGICGSDLHYYLEGAIGAATIRQPFVPGHEFSCRVAEDRPDLNLKKGQLVAVDPARPCGHCEWCHASYPNLCPNVQFTGAPPFHGALTQRLTAFPYQIFSLPEWFTPEQAVMLETLGIAVHAMDLAKVHLLETVAILGGVAASQGSVSLTVMCAVVVFAAIAGDSAGYGVGARYGQRILSVRPLRRRAGRIEAARATLARRGGPAVLGGRFVAFLHAVMPLVAGTSHMSYRRFLVFNATGGLLWGTGAVLAGYLAGNSYTVIERTFGRASAIVAGATVVIAVVLWRVSRWRRKRRAPPPSPASARPAARALRAL